MLKTCFNFHSPCGSKQQKLGACATAAGKGSPQTTLLSAARVQWPGSRKFTQYPTEEGGAGDGNLREELKILGLDRVMTHSQELLHQSTRLRQLAVLESSILKVSFFKYIGDCFINTCLEKIPNPSVMKFWYYNNISNYHLVSCFTHCAKYFKCTCLI